MLLIARRYQRILVYLCSLVLALGAPWAGAAPPHRDGGQSRAPRAEHRPAQPRHTQSPRREHPRAEQRRPQHRDKAPAPRLNRHRSSPVHRNYAPAPRHDHSRAYYHHDLPLGALLLTLGGLAYYYHSGLFYQPLEQGYVVVGAPLGAVVPSLPPAYRIVLSAGQLYYVVGNTYYLPHAQGYVVVSPPNALDLNAPPSVPELGYSYPPYSNQDGDQQARDRYECHRWGVDQSGFDPSLGNATRTGGRDAYYRAMNACLTGRGYGVR